MKLIVAGGREFTDYKLLSAKLDLFIKNIAEPIEIVSGSCDTGEHTFTRKDGTKVYGADGLGEKYAEEKGYPVQIYPADWKKYKAAAGPMRNRLMANYATHCVCFWDGQSSGTKSMIKIAQFECLLPTRVVIYLP